MARYVEQFKTTAAFYTSFVLRHVRVQLAVAALKIGVGYQAWHAMSGAGDIDHIEVILIDDPIEMNIDEVQARCGAHPHA